MVVTLTLIRFFAHFDFDSLPLLYPIWDNGPTLFSVPLTLSLLLALPGSQANYVNIA